MADHNQIPWREWSEETFAEAKAQDKPILLDIGAVWCHWCHVMDEGIPGDPVHTGTYANPHVQQRIRDHFIAVKVDNDRRPDINARYNMGGWPTTVFLTPDGDTLYGETYVPPPRMVGLLDYIADLWKNHRDQIIEQTAEVRAQRAQAEPSASASSSLDPATLDNITEAIKRNFDFAYGGFGTQPKFPHPAALAFALEQYAQTGNPELRTVAEKTLYAMADGGMYDRYAGGFFRYSTTRDWSVPHFEKMLEDNAKLTSVYALAAAVLDNPYYLDVVKSAHGWLLSDMRDPETGAFAGSQDADQEEHYYGRPLDVRATMPTPYIDRTVYAGWNALMVSALVDRYKLTGEAEILEAARKAYSFLTNTMLVIGMNGNEGAKYALQHFYGQGDIQGAVGLLSDQTAFLTASLDLYEVTGEGNYLADAQSAARCIVSELQDKQGGGFYDLPSQPDAIGELARPKKDMGENAEVALALWRLAHMDFSDPSRFRQAAERALQLFAQEYMKYSFFAASYGRAVAALQWELHIVITGAMDDPRTQALQKAAWKVPAPGKAVETLDAAAGEARGYPPNPDGSPHAYVCVGTNCTVVDDPDDAAWKMLPAPSVRG